MRAARWRFAKGLHDIGNGIWAYLQPDGSWGWSNAGLIVDGDRTLLVDTLFDLKLTREMLETMRRSVAAAAHIQTLVNTHANGDHCYGNELVAGAEIVASEATAEQMNELPPAAFHQLVQTAGKLGRGGELIAELFRPFDFSDVTLTMPTRVFHGELRLKVGDKDVRLIEVGPAHTKGDTLVHVPGDRVIFTGDILFSEGTPIAWAGPVQNWIAACNKILDMDIDVVVPGHGSITDKAGVAAMRGYLQYVTDEARRRFDKGMTATEAAFDIALGPYVKWGNAERIVVTVDTLFADFSGEPRPFNPVPLFEQMAKMRDNLAHGSDEMSTVKGS
jgi:cyclase